MVSLVLPIVLYYLRSYCPCNLSIYTYISTLCILYTFVLCIFFSAAKNIQKQSKWQIWAIYCMIMRSMVYYATWFGFPTTKSSKLICVFLMSYISDCLGNYAYILTLRNFWDGVYGLSKILRGVCFGKKQPKSSRNMTKNGSDDLVKMYPRMCWCIYSDNINNFTNLPSIEKFCALRANIPKLCLH